MDVYHGMPLPLILGVMHTKDIAFVETVRGNNCVQVSMQGGMCARMVLYLSLEDWAGCCRFYLCCQRMVLGTASPSITTVSCAAWGLGCGMLAWTGGMMKRTQQARSRFGDSSLQWQQDVLLWWTSSSRSGKYKGDGGIKGLGKRGEMAQESTCWKRSSSRQARTAGRTGARLLTMTIWYGSRAATQAS